MEKIYLPFETEDTIIDPLDLKVMWDMGEEKFFVGRLGNYDDVKTAVLFDKVHEAESYLLKNRARLVAEQEFLVDAIQRKIDNEFKGLPNSDYLDTENDLFVIWLEEYISGQNGFYIPYIIANYFKISDIRGFREEDKYNPDNYPDYDWLDIYVGQVAEHLCSKLNLHGGNLYFDYLECDGSWGMFYSVPQSEVIDLEEDNYCYDCEMAESVCVCGEVTKETQTEIVPELTSAIYLLVNMYGEDLVKEALKQYLEDQKVG